MRRKLFFILFSFGMFTYSIYGQESSVYISKLQTRALIGVSIPVTKPDATFDYHISDKRSIYIHTPFSISYFFHKHFGVELNYQFETPIKDRTNTIITSVQSDYGDNYDVRLEKNDDIGSEKYQLYLGLVYRLETNKFYTYPKIGIGITGCYTDFEKMYLKEKNSNNEYQISYSGIPKFYFILAPSVSFGYKISKRIYFNADIMLSYYKPNIVYKKEFTNLYTKRSTVENIDYKKNIFTLSLGAGAIIVLR